ncbi:hypothetical protein FA15DRAFT_604879 [Coprinopsis marcescibilis]|uniref:Uncharacterized protein n=1 Tax=Coprinopsis marcescibilis TaxID=230819 RepID=A0A5C3KBT1_COPMA|nr:hypothetical protein FA15DRAFT_604879 [Coprinopsis marcescibilis]
MLSLQALNPKPGFPLVPGQPKLGPLVLDKETGIEVPEPLCIHLRGYQREGVSFLYRQYKEGLGALLGDDMGLGKTIQVIAFLSAIMKKTGTALDEGRRHHYVSNLQDARSWRKTGKLQPANTKWPTCLIIAPSTVVHNWEREFQTWGYFEVGIYTGTPKDRETTLRDFKLGRLDVLVTSFDIARKDIDLLDDLALSCVIVDEVHRVKNDSSQITNAFHRFACTVRMGLTGTTVQNSYKEMWTILDWTNPGKLGTARQWNGYVVKPLTVGQSSAATPEQTVRAAAVARVLKEKLLPKFFLRRTKDIIRDQLPKKTDQVVFCPLTRAQISAYKNILEMEEVQNLIKRDQPCDCGSRKSSKTCCHPFEAAHVFKYMSILIKLSNHLVLILPGGPKDTADQTATNRALARVAFPDGRVPKYGTAILEEGFCGKWGTLNVLLREWRVDTTNKVLIFTKSVKLLEALEFHLNARSYRFLKLDGSTKQSERMPMIDRFNNDPEVFIFLISTLAGGTGLNLTGANKVVIFDPNWNPAHDLQAMDRAFRFGQRRDVSVYRLLGAGSVEELIYARQIYKQQQMAIAYDASFQTRYFEGIQGDVTKRGELFGLENIFKLQEDKWATQMAIEKANLAELDWALTNLKGAKGKRASNKELLEAEAKVGKEDSTVKGLARLLFEDDLPEVKETEEDKITKSLNAIGVKYSHMNDKILRPSKVEEERTKQTIRKKRVNKAKVAEGSGKGDGDSDGKKEEPKVWPPVRNRKRKLDAVDSLSARREALIALGLISSPAELTKFAGEFSKQTLEEQQSIIAILDKWVVDNADELGR